MGAAQSIQDGIAYYEGAPADGQFIWIQETSGEVRFAQDLSRGQGGVFRTIHPMLSKGEPVTSAGEMMFKDGQLIWINNGSGHYQPAIGEVFAVRDLLVNSFGLQGPAEVVPYDK